VGQMIGGVCLAAITCGLGSSLGISLISEGINDIVYGIRGAISRRFSWKDYGIQKGVSLTICFVTLGCSAVKQAAQAAGTTGTTSMLKATDRGTLTIMKNSFRTVGSGALKGISSTSWKLACKQVAVTCVETGVQQIANYAANSVSNKALSAFIDTIRTEIECILLVEQSKPEYERVVNRTIDADKFNGNKQWRQQIEQIASQLMSKQKTNKLKNLNLCPVEGAKRYLNVVVNDMFEKIKIDPEGRKKFEELKKRTKNEPGKAKSYSEKLALDIMNGKQGDNVVLSVLAIITQTPVTVLQTSSDDALNQDPDNPNVELNYTPAKIDETTGALVDGHYEPTKGMAATAGAGPTDCLFAAILSQMPDKFQSIADVRAQCAAFILTTPSFIEGIYPAVSVMNQCRTPLRRKLLMGEGATLTPSQEKEIEKML
ncbi:unnamed protein product, partial [Didymodactylos carnosus]